MSGRIIDELEWRGMIAICTDVGALRAAMDTGPITFYCGFDPTAPSLHFGNLVQLVTMRRIQEAGHSPIAVVGGATGLVGDPSGRSSERVLNEEDVVAGWVDRIRAQVERFLDFEGQHPARVVNNLDWTGPMSAIAFLRDIGKHFSVSRMLDKEAVSARLQAGGISYTEFSYQILQANDYLELYRRYGCTLQTGGSDQWGNLTAGVDLIRRVEGVSVHALATPLLTRADGTKHGKTAEGSVWLDPEMMSPYAFYQYFINATDDEVGPLLRTFSFRSTEEIQALEATIGERPEAREAQQVLATELTALVHGEDEARRVAAASRAVFGGADGELRELDERVLASAAAELPRLEVRAEMPSLLDLLVESGLASSRSDARRTIAEGGAYLNNRRVTDPALVPATDDLLHGRWLLLRRGKRRVAVVERT
ncbi:MAG TPA: tyrosine--tRNA ligase [candidate division Zixibacteria bacterium]|nr:tyrosine--tRNA ligase [candidate division Zixibacteria bacterium]